MVASSARVYHITKSKKEKKGKIRPKNWSKLTKSGKNGPKMAQNRKKVPRKIRNLKPPTDFISRHETHPDDVPTARSTDPTADLHF
jgi:hypothetical protein